MIHQLFLEKNKNLRLWLLIIIPFTFYLNSLFNGYALDDSAVITENRLTKKGLKGIKELATHHLFYGYMNNGDKSTGAYRPLSLITHAIEYHLFGKNPFVSHLINVIELGI